MTEFAVCSGVVTVDCVYFIGRALVYGGWDASFSILASVEMLSSVAGHGWQTLPTPMFASDAAFSSVSLPA